MLRYISFHYVQFEAGISRSESAFVGEATSLCPFEAAFKNPHLVHYFRAKIVFYTLSGETIFLNNGGRMPTVLS